MKALSSAAAHHHAALRHCDCAPSGPAKLNFPAHLGRRAMVPLSSTVFHCGSARRDPPRGSRLRASCRSPAGRCPEGISSMMMLPDRARSAPAAARGRRRAPHPCTRHPAGGGWEAQLVSATVLLAFERVWGVTGPRPLSALACTGLGRAGVRACRMLRQRGGQCSRRCSAPALVPDVHPGVRLRHATFCDANCPYASPSPFSVPSDGGRMTAGRCAGTLSLSRCSPLCWTFSLRRRPMMVPGPVYAFDVAPRRGGGATLRPAGTVHRARFAAVLLPVGCRHGKAGGF